MRVKLLACVLLTVVASACSGNGNQSMQKSDSVCVDSMPDISGQWVIENIFFDDSTYVRPSEVSPGSSQYINFKSIRHNYM